MQWQWRWRSPDRASGAAVRAIGIADSRIARTVVMACLEKNREDRPQSVAELRAMLDGCTDVTPWTEADANQWWALHRPEPVQRAS